MIYLVSLSIFHKTASYIMRKISFYKKNVNIQKYTLKEEGKSEINWGYFFIVNDKNMLKNVLYIFFSPSYRNIKSFHVQKEKSSSRFPTSF